MSHADVWNLGKDNVDLRIKASAFSRVQRYFPECTVLVSNLEAHVQEAEMLMFPMKKADEEAWMAAVAQEAFPKVNMNPTFHIQIEAKYLTILSYIIVAV